VTTHWFPSGTADTSKDSALASILTGKMDFTANNPSAQISVDVWGGNVVLTGVLPGQAEIDRAIALVRDTPGVLSVTSYLAPN
jgi:osmotically-inducible protein OsmY